MKTLLFCYVAFMLVAFAQAKWRREEGNFDVNSVIDMDDDDDYYSYDTETRRSRKLAKSQVRCAVETLCDCKGATAGSIVVLQVLHIVF